MTAQPNQAAFAKAASIDLRHGEFAVMHADRASYLTGAHYHETIAWAFDGVPAAINHTIAHLLLGQALHIMDANTKPLDYQGNFASEILVFAIEKLLDQMRDEFILSGRIFFDPNAKEKFIADVQKSYRECYNRETRTRVRVWRLGEIEGQTKGKTYEEVRLLTGFSDFDTQTYTQERGINLISSRDAIGMKLAARYNLPFGKATWWLLDAGAGKPHYYAGEDPDQISNLPKSSNGIEDFKPFICPSPKKILKIYDLITPVIVHMAKKYQEICIGEENQNINGHHRPKKLFDNIIMADMNRLMRRIHYTPKMFRHLVQTIG